ncbi:T9SS type A sorting domain-containing protein, partial [candidate division WOR-3 bacterium]|nr:T9SS type A sorting domain-containing protein [candidate division WOR-3 bacterium]
SAGGIVIMDKFLRFPVISPATISGDFGDYGPIIDSAFASFDSIPVPPYYDDWVLLFFSEKTNAPVIDSSNIDSVLRLSGGHSWHIDTLYQVKTDWTGDTILIISWWPIYGIEEETDYRLPLTYHLFQNSPNPFVNRTIIRYAVGSDEGQKVKKSKSQKVSPPPADLSFILYPLSFSDPVAVGDTIYPDSLTITDLKGHISVKPVVIRAVGSKQCKISNAKLAISNESLLAPRPTPYAPRPTLLAPRSSLLTTHYSLLATSLSIYDLAGRLVRTLVDMPHSPGIYSVEWDGKDSEGNKVKSGIYFCRLEVGGRTVASMKMVKIR